MSYEEARSWTELAKDALIEASSDSSSRYVQGEYLRAIALALIAIAEK